MIHEVTDVYFTLKHYAGGEEDVGKKEWIFFLDCLSGKCEYSIELNGLQIQILQKGVTHRRLMSKMVRLELQDKVC